MVWASVVPAAISVISNILGAKSAKKAADRKTRDITAQYSPEMMRKLFALYYGGLLPGGGAPWSPGPGANGQPIQPDAGQALAYQILQLLQNPGKISPIEYERAQEQGNLFQRTSQNATTAAGARGGFGQNSGILQALMLAGLMSNQRLRNERMRDLTNTSEALRRQDIGAGASLYNQALGQIFGLQQGKAATLAGLPVASNQAAYAGVGNVFGLLADAFGQPRKDSVTQLQQTPNNTQALFNFGANLFGSKGGTW